MLIGLGVGKYNGTPRRKVLKTGFQNEVMDKRRETCSV